MGYMDAIQLGGISGSALPAAASAFNPMAALGGLGMEAASAWYGNRMAEKRQHEAFDQQKWMMQNRYQMQTKDMMAAGLNPMLAVSQAPPMPGSVGQAQTSRPDFLNAVSNALVSSAQAQKTMQETHNLKTENLQNMIAWPTMMKKLDEEINNLQQLVKTGQADESQKKKLAQLQQQQYEMQRPEEIASGSQAAVFAAQLQRALKPLIDMLGGASRIGR